MVIWEIVGAAGGLAGAGVGVWGVLKAREANQIARDAHGTAVASRKEAEQANKIAAEANSLSDQANELSKKANAIAEKAMEAQVIAERRSHGAQLIFQTGYSGIRRDDSRGTYLVVPLQNVGIAPAYDARMRIRQIGASEWYAADGPREIGPSGESCVFALKIEQDFFREGEGGRVLDYLVTYRDRLGHHNMQFRVHMSGLWGNSSWSFRHLDTCLDGKRLPFAEAPEKLAVGIAFIEGDGICMTPPAGTQA